MQIGKLSLSVILPLFALFIAASGAIAFVEEASCTINAGHTDVDRVQHLVNDQIHIAFSDQCTQTVLEDCFLAIGSIYGRASGQAIRDRLLDTCGVLSGEVLTRSPAHAYAWLIHAKVSGERENWEDMQAALQASQFASPNSGWLSRRRFVVGEQYYAHLNEQARSSHAQNIAVAVQTPDGRQQVALYYRQRPETRPRITEAVEALTPNQQAAFLSTLRSVSSTLSSYGSG